MEKVSLIITVRNEEKTIADLLHSIEAQSLKPSEVVIVDGGSTDHTFKVLSDWKPSFPTTILQKKGNRSVGRNTAIEIAAGPIIAITDAGCVLDRNWLLEITKPFSNGLDVVAGYYTANAQTAFEKAAACYMLVMPEQVNESDFLPATRSMALTKQIWEQAGKFKEPFTYNEDYVFAHALKRIHAKMTFTRKAVVHWQPPSNVSSFIKQIYKFAYGDGYALIFRPKVLMIFVRYIVGAYVLSLSPMLAAIFFTLYVLWSIQKNYAHVKDSNALFILPLLQISTDVVVMAGTVLGVKWKVLSRYDG